MSEKGAILQTCTQEMVKYIEHLRNERENLDSCIDQEELKKKDILHKIDELNSNLAIITKNLDGNYKKRNHCDRALSDAETGLLKIIESSQILLTLMQREAEALRS